MKRLTLLTGACLLALGLASTAQAGSGNMVGLAGGCPPGGDWRLQKVGGVIEGLDVGNLRDRNGDTYVCVRDNRGLTAKNRETTLVVRDNNLRIPPGVVNNSD